MVTDRFLDTANLQPNYPKDVCKGKWIDNDIHSNTVYIRAKT